MIQIKTKLNQEHDKSIDATIIIASEVKTDFLAVTVKLKRCQAK